VFTVFLVLRISLLFFESTYVLLIILKVSLLSFLWAWCGKERLEENQRGNYAEF
jgi:hypothetical protein